MRTLSHNRYRKLVLLCLANILALAAILASDRQANAQAVGVSFTGVISSLFPPSGTIDTFGLFGPAGTNLAGRHFTATVSYVPGDFIVEDGGAYYFTTMPGSIVESVTIGGRTLQYTVSAGSAAVYLVDVVTFLPKQEFSVLNTVNNLYFSGLQIIYTPSTLSSLYVPALPLRHAGIDLVFFVPGPFGGTENITQAPDSLEIVGPLAGVTQTLSVNYVATNPIPFEAVSDDASTPMTWNNVLVYKTSGGRGGYSTTLPFTTTPGTQTDQTYASMGGQLTTTVTQDGDSQTHVLTVTGTAIPANTITTELSAAYAGGTTPDLLGKIATYESGYSQFSTRSLYGQTALWPVESYDGGSHIGLMQVCTTRTTRCPDAGFGYAFDWKQNADAGASLFTGNIQIGRNHLKRMVQNNPGLVLPTGTALGLMLENEALSFYNVGTGFDYYTVANSSGTPTFEENFGGDPVGTTYADCVRQQTPPVRVNCPR